MMTIVAEDSFGMAHTLPQPKGLHFVQEYGVPADSISLEFPGALPPFLETIQVRLGEETLLNGIVDEQELRRSSGGTESSLYARSLAALLLDSECKPMTLQNPGTEDLFCLTAEPLGFRSRLPVAVFPGQYRIDKGTSLWTALSDFISLTLGAVLTLRGRELSVFSLNPSPAQRVDESQILSLKENYRRFGRVSEVRYKTRPEEEYLWSGKAESGQAMGPGAVRYLNLSAYPSWQWEERLRACLRQGEGQRTACAVLRGCVNGEVGNAVFLPPPFDQSGPLYLTAAELRLDTGGWQTRWELKKADAFREGEFLCG